MAARNSCLSRSVPERHFACCWDAGQPGDKQTILAILFATFLLSAHLPRVGFIQKVLSSSSDFRHAFLHSWVRTLRLRCWWDFCISRVSDQNGVSLQYIMLEIHHSGREPSICDRIDTRQEVKFWLWIIRLIEERYWTLSWLLTSGHSTLSPVLSWRNQPNCCVVAFLWFIGSDKSIGKPKRTNGVAIWSGRFIKIADYWQWQINQ